MPICFLIIIFGCSSPSQQRSETIDAHQLIKLQKEGIPVIDIRTQKEYDQGHIPSVLHIDFFGINFMDEMKKQNPSAPIIIHCASGGRSKKATEILHKAGFKKVYDYTGGFADWKLKQLKNE